MKAQDFKNENTGKFVWFNGANGLEGAILNNWIEDTYEEAVKAQAFREGITEEEVKNDYHDWYYIMPIEDIDNEDLQMVLDKVGK